MTGAEEACSQTRLQVGLVIKPHTCACTCACTVHVHAHVGVPWWELLVEVWASVGRRLRSEDAKDDFANPVE